MNKISSKKEQTSSCFFKEATSIDSVSIFDSIRPRSCASEAPVSKFHRPCNK